MIKLDFKKQSDTDNSIFYRFILNEKTIFWFTLHDNKYIYSIGIRTNDLFPYSRISLFADTDENKPYYYKEMKIESYSLNYNPVVTKECIKELRLAYDIAVEIDDFFKNKFLQEYVNNT